MWQLPWWTCFCSFPSHLFELDVTNTCVSNNFVFHYATEWKFEFICLHSTSPSTHSHALQSACQLVYSTYIHKFFMCFSSCHDWCKYLILPSLFLFFSSSSTSINFLFFLSPQTLRKPTRTGESAHWKVSKEVIRLAAHSAYSGPFIISAYDTWHSQRHVTHLGRTRVMLMHRNIM